MFIGVLWHNGFNIFTKLLLLPLNLSQTLDQPSRTFFFRQFIMMNWMVNKRSSCFAIVHFHWIIEMIGLIKNLKRSLILAKPVNSKFFGCIYRPHNRTKWSPTKLLSKGCSEGIHFPINLQVKSLKIALKRTFSELYISRIL